MLHVHGNCYVNECYISGFSCLIDNPEQFTVEISPGFMLVIGEEASPCC
jgi:hypothetical protein